MGIPNNALSSKACDNGTHFSSAAVALIRSLPSNSAEIVLSINRIAFGAMLAGRESNSVRVLNAKRRDGSRMA
jgi:hypothetical protein